MNRVGKDQPVGAVGRKGDRGGLSGFEFEYAEVAEACRLFGPLVHSHRLRTPPRGDRATRVGCPVRVRFPGQPHFVAA